MGANAVGAETADYFAVDKILKKIIQAERMFVVRTKERNSNPKALKEKRMSLSRRSYRATNHGTYRGSAHEAMILNLEKISIDDIIDSAQAIQPSRKRGLS